MNAPHFTWGELQTATKGNWTDPNSGQLNDPGISLLSTDTRDLPEGSMFLALTGIHFDGHNFIEKAVEMGAKGICAEKLSKNQSQALETASIPCILVNNSLRAYHSIASYHRCRFQDIPVIAITGSSGKTTTKEILGMVLRRQFGENVLLTRANTNNQIGVPQNLLRLTSAHQAAILELGTSFSGEIKVLTEMVLPTIAVLTNVAPVHLEGLKNLEGVIKEKSYIFSTLTKTGGCAIIPYNLRNRYQFLTDHPKVEVKTFGFEKDADVRIVFKKNSLSGSEFFVFHWQSKQPLRVHWQLHGSHLALDAGAAVAVAKILGISDKVILEGLSVCQATSMRMQINWDKDTCWIVDAYNANPGSTRAFIEWLATLDWGELENAEKHIILGDMFELGDKEYQFHYDILEEAIRKLPEMKIYPVGAMMSKAAMNLGMSSYETPESLKLFLDSKIKAGNVVALKGSRGMQLETLLPWASP